MVAPTAIGSGTPSPPTLESGLCSGLSTPRDSTSPAFASIVGLTPCLLPPRPLSPSSPAISSPSQHRRRQEESRTYHTPAQSCPACDPCPARQLGQQHQQPRPHRTTAVAAKPVSVVGNASRSATVCCPPARAALSSTSSAKPATGRPRLWRRAPPWATLRFCSRLQVAAPRPSSLMLKPPCA